jgi:hypothetical protein
MSRNLTESEARVAVAMVLRKYKAEDLLRRFPGADWEDVKKALQAAAPTLALPVDPDPLAPASGKTGMDALSALTQQALHQAVELECSLQGLLGVLDRLPDEAHLLEQADNLAHEWKEGNMVTPLHQVLVHLLCRRYILVPRPFLLPVDDISRNSHDKPSPT